MSMCFLASYDAETYENALAQVSKMSKKIEVVCSRGESGRSRRVGEEYRHILDPTIVRSKGTPRGSTNAKMRRRYRWCHGVDYNRRICPMNDEEPDDEVSI
ncbi:uncharacterized protein DS421_13g411380 [Arachis hypogaea]|nr:uncharacterized protein DS421_13g411380 [Arachis hypogaea]